ncbi:hypothetical protein ABZY81_40330 [Streptomyces sp. NPDC006514]|uniref:hypothetical protein n=1 Tax=Streptomyces sp. NPDC006514 TaxID=3154308 RepID=UPI0033A02725
MADFLTVALRGVPTLVSAWQIITGDRFTTALRAVGQTNATAAAALIDQAKSAHLYEHVQADLHGAANNLLVAETAFGQLYTRQGYAKAAQMAMLGALCYASLERSAEAEHQKNRARGHISSFDTMMPWNVLGTGTRRFWDDRAEVEAVEHVLAVLRRELGPGTISRRPVLDSGPHSALERAAATRPLVPRRPQALQTQQANPARLQFWLTYRQVENINFEMESVGFKNWNVYVGEVCLGKVLRERKHNWLAIPAGFQPLSGRSQKSRAAAERLVRYQRDCAEQGRYRPPGCTSAWSCGVVELPMSATSQPL